MSFFAHSFLFSSLAKEESDVRGLHSSHEGIRGQKGVFLPSPTPKPRKWELLANTYVIWIQNVHSRRRQHGTVYLGVRQGRGRHGDQEEGPGGSIRAFDGCS